MKPTHGGKRPNAGRKPGTGSGRKTVSRSVSLTPEQWGKLDRISSGKRSGWIAGKIDEA
jgi:hypothetical protein